MKSAVVGHSWLCCTIQANRARVVPKIPWRCQRVHSPFQEDTARCATAVLVCPWSLWLQADRHLHGPSWLTHHGHFSRSESLLVNSDLHGRGNPDFPRVQTTQPTSTCQSHCGHTQWGSEHELSHKAAGLTKLTEQTLCCPPIWAVGCYGYWATQLNVGLA